ncbi:hypothetical protein J4205_03895 [Candidatus Pacearchaeota archaeon]|nr:hypothetical protein [Candidatus Pacearchaeota archaeon]
MKQVEGYVFSAEFEDDSRKLIFGNYSKEGPELFEERLRCYSTKDRATKDAHKFCKENKGIRYSEVSHVDLTYAENETDLINLNGESNLVVMLLLDENDSSLHSRRALIGPVVEGKRGMYPIPGSKLRDNGYRTFKKKGDRNALERARYCWNEVRRQGALPCVIGQLKIRKVKKIK